MKKYINMLFCSMIFFLSVACEDDALLDPQIDAGTDAGSYGNISIPSDSTKPEIETNPEIF